MANEDKVIETIPVGPLGLVPLKSVSCALAHRAAERA